uniref:Cellular retinoic acid binding protein 2 n=2 Tax=Boreoeutheria TaxID=1437010 RepID=A0A9L0SF36_HORSE
MRRSCLRNSESEEVRLGEPDPGLLTHQGGAAARAGLPGAEHCLSAPPPYTLPSPSGRADHLPSASHSELSLLQLPHWEGARLVPGAPLKVNLSPLPAGVNVMLRKIAVAAASKPAVEIKQEGDTFYIKTSTTVRTTEINFKIGEEFEEQTVDGRPCKSLVKWESENKMVCEQRLLKGEGPKTSWTRELTNDGELILTMTADDIVCTRVYVRE